MLLEEDVLLCHLCIVKYLCLNLCHLTVTSGSITLAKTMLFHMINAIICMELYLLKMIFVEEFFPENMISWTEIFGQLTFQMSPASL